MSLFNGPGSEDLNKMSCPKCSKDTPKLTELEINSKLKAIPSWKINEAKSMITKEFTARNFTSAIKFFNDVAEIAEKEGHHPDLHLTNYRDVEVNISTHAIKGLSISDFILATKIDTLEIDYSPKWLKKFQEKL